ncbi:hypothetical protein JANAI62_11430 [Jannaschia pagri]|uniref:Uncharacterized protein n=1 Tax=Jannaschia pagri TaxID=2829797 RepID=A0ABQ4NJD0_9RHOB|nr:MULTISPECIES: hypothetical protein [unclassified Jannaschia]GIT90688.1 hypothetical protein JANAI61_11460 [Jannaschia sp. AI_61]GIT94520.1 hypothetical protein JANAI62_11430 [Jannaschia sp. AI_62]
MTKYLLLLAVALPTAALAHDPLRLPDYAPKTFWLDGQSGAEGPGDSPIRLVEHPGQGQVALSVNQLWQYQHVYRQRLTHLSRHLGVERAKARAHHDAIHAVLGRAGSIQPAALIPLDGGRLYPDG